MADGMALAIAGGIANRMAEQMAKLWQNYAPNPNPNPNPTSVVALRFARWTNQVQIVKALTREAESLGFGATA